MKKRMIMPRARTAALAAVSLVALSGCQMMKDLFSLQREITREFDVEASSVNLSNSELTISIDRSPVDDEGREAKESLARDIAEYVRDHYGGYENLERVSIEFTNRTSVGPVTVTRGQGSFSFETSDLGEPEVAP